MLFLQVILSFTSFQPKGLLLVVWSCKEQPLHHSEIGITEEMSTMPRIQPSSWSQYEFSITFKLQLIHYSLPQKNDRFSDSQFYALSMALESTQQGQEQKMPQNLQSTIQLHPNIQDVKHSIKYNPQVKT